MSLHSELVAAGLPVLGTAVEGETVHFTRALTEQEKDTYESIVNPIMHRQSKARVDANNVPGWVTLTQAEFVTWCDNNLLTDAAIDALTLNAGLKTNIKGINLFVRNGGKMLIALRNWTRILE